MKRFQKIVILKVYPTLVGHIATDRPLPDKLQVNNYFMGKYFDEIQEIITSNKRQFLKQSDYFKRRRIKNNLVKLCMLFNVIKYSVLFVFGHGFSDNTRTILADWSLFIGTIRKYMVLAHIVSFVWGLKLNQMLYPNKINNKETYDWIYLFQMMRGKVNPSQVGLNRSDTITLKRFSAMSKIIFRLTTYTFWNAGKF